MAPEKETIMVLKVDLQCDRCYRKVKKVICQFPQIRDQIYNEKNNTVTIKVVCCSPEKIREKLCIKGRKSIISIDILEPPKPKPPPAPAPEKPPPAAPAPEPQKPPPPPKPDPKPPAAKPAPPPQPEKPKDKPPPPLPVPVPEKPKDKPPPPPKPDPKPPPPDPPKPVAPPPPQPKPQPSLPPPQPQPCYPPPPGIYVCCQECSEGRPGGPCFSGSYSNRPGLCEPPYAPPPCGYGTTTGPGYYPGGWPCGQYQTGYYPSRCGDCFSEENPQACVIM